MPANINKYIKSNATGGAAIKTRGIADKFIKASPVTTPTDSINQLAETAELSGLGKEAQAIVVPRKKLSLLQRVGALLSGFETGNAVYQGIEQKSLIKGVGEYAKNIVQGVGSAVTGRDFGQTEKKTYRDLVEKIGVKNGVAKFGLGLVGDILLDPTTYFGGAIAKGAVKGGKVAGSTLFKGVEKVAPDVAKGLAITGKGVKDALGKGFVYGYGASKGLATKTLENAGELNKAKAKIITENIEQLGTGTLSKTQQEELVMKLLEGKRKELALGRGGKGKKAALALAKSDDPVVDAALKARIARSQEFAKKADITDAYATYFPSIDKNRVQRFIESTKGLRVGSEGYKKEFRDLLKDTDLVRNPAEAFGRYEWEVTKNEMVRNQLKEVVGTFGKPLKAFKDEKVAAEAGYKLVKEKGFKGKEIGWMLDNDKKFIDSLVEPSYVALDAIAKGTGFDAVTSLFKRSVTGLFPAFHIRNYVSGIIQNYEVLGAQALNPKYIAGGQKLAYNLATDAPIKGTMKIAGKEWQLADLMKPFAKRFPQDSTYINDIADATSKKILPNIVEGGKINKAGLKQAAIDTAKTAGIGSDSLVFRTTRAIGGYIETQQKATAYLVALSQGKTISEALDLATKAGFDYRALTGFESKVLRRIIPFYSFTRKNLELQLRTLGENPQRIGNIIDIMKNATADLTPEQREALPDYLKEQFVVSFGNDAEGNPQLSGGFGTPIEQPGQLIGENPIRRFASQSNPVIKLFLERAFNYDTFRNQPLSESINANQYVKAPQFIKDFVGFRTIEKVNKDGTKKTTYTADAKKMQLLNALPTTRGASYIAAIYDEKATTKAKIAKALTGIKPNKIDLETVEYFKNLDKQKELEDLLIRAGVLKKFEKIYKPKNQTSK